MPSRNRVSRRCFLQRAAAALAALTIIPRHVLAAAGSPGANDRIGLGMIGAGRRTHQILGDVQRVTGLQGSARIVAVSDI